MEIKQSAIKSCTFDHEWSNAYGKNYDHNIVLQNGDAGTITAKSEMPDKFGVGKLLTYTITPNGNRPAKIKSADPKLFAGTQQSAPSDGTTIVAIGKLQEELNALKEVVKQLVKHMKLVYVAPKPVEQPKPQPEPEPIGDQDDLPF